MGLKLNLGSFEIISIFDDAIDKESSDTKGYITGGHRNWKKFLKIKEGEDPSVFEIEMLTLEQRESVNEDMTLTYSEAGAVMPAYDGKRYAKAFSLCVKGWKNLDLEYSRSKEQLSDEVMEILGQAIHRTVFEVGKVILDGSILTGEAKN